MNLKKTDGHSVDRQRIEKMVKLRNIYLDYVKKFFPNFDYTIIWDLDIIGMVYLDGIQNSIYHLEKDKKDKYKDKYKYDEDDKDIDAICAYGIYRWGGVSLYYDTYAHISNNSNSKEFHISNKLSHDIKTGLSVKYPRGTPPIKVKSCFSGFTIYKTRSLLGDHIKYDMTPEISNNLECEHVRLHKKLNGEMCMNPSMINLVMLND